MSPSHAHLKDDSKKMSPVVGQSCVFPSEDPNGYAVHDACRRIVDWEATGIEDRNYRVILYDYQFKLDTCFSLSALLKLMMRDWQSSIDGVGVVKVVH